jgi:hypothetical protein
MRDYRMTMRLKPGVLVRETPRPSMITLSRAVCLLSAVLGCACSGEDSSPGASGGASGSGGGSGAAGNAGTAGKGETRGWVGTLGITIAGADVEGTVPARSSFFGVVYDKPAPIEGAKFEPAEEIGDCQLLLPLNPFCDPACDIKSVCTADAVCTPYSTAQNLGVLTLSGLMPADFSMDPAAPSYKYQPPPSVRLPYPPCSEGDRVSLTAPSVGFTMAAGCVAPIVLDNDTIPVRANQALSLSWQPPTTTGTRVGIDLEIAHHGGAAGKIVCDVADTGSFVIPEPLVTRLVGLGLAGFPAITLTRHVRIAASSEPDVYFSIASTTSRLVDTGVISCGATMPCPSGMTCKANKTCE